MIRTSTSTHYYCFCDSSTNTAERRRRKKRSSNDNGKSVFNIRRKRTGRAAQASHSTSTSTSTSTSSFVEGLFSPRLTDTVHALLRDVLRPGCYAVDLTAGNGNDTLMLAKLCCRLVKADDEEEGNNDNDSNNNEGVVVEGRVLAIDVQASAVEATQMRLERELKVSRESLHRHIVVQQACHSRLEEFLPSVFGGRQGTDVVVDDVGVLRDDMIGSNVAQPCLDAVVANLGWLPSLGSNTARPTIDRSQTTQASTTVKAAEVGLRYLRVRGIAIFTCYVRRSEGAREYDALRELIKDLPAKMFHAVEISITNRQGSPIILAIRRVQ